jgi:NADPH-dependent 2,4-dienoyl-CoA reductase/sulfur reductase-like enzyme
VRGRERIVILGNGVAGNTALEAIRRSGSSTEVVLLSEEPYPEYSACVLPHYVSGYLPRKRVFLKSIKDYQGVRTRLGERVRGIDPHRSRVFLEKGSLFYDQLIIATGGEPVIPSFRGMEGKGIYPLKTLRDADRLARIQPRRVAVIGSNLIGVEAAAALKMRGHQVSLISRRWILPRILDEDVGQRAQRILEKKGINIYTREGVWEIVLKGREVRAVQTEKRRIPCDLVVLAVGIKPRVDIAGQAGIGIGPLGGIKVNERMETSHSRVYSCGDCSEPVDSTTGKTVLQLRWFNARQMGRVAGLNCLGIKSTYGRTWAGVVLDLFGTAVGSVGELSLDLKEKKVEVIETDDGTSYARVLISDHVIKGGQFIGRTEEAGILLSLIRNGYPYRGSLGGVSRFPWYRKLDRYLEPKHGGD